jgi:hypothetical protein
MARPKKQVAVMKRVMIPVAIVYLLTMAAMLTFPGITPFNTIEPRILGIPFVFAWYLMWIVGAFVVLSLLYKAYEE